MVGASSSRQADVNRRQHMQSVPEAYNHTVLAVQVSQVLVSSSCRMFLVCRCCCRFVLVLANSRHARVSHLCHAAPAVRPAAALMRCPGQLPLNADFSLSPSALLCKTGPVHLYLSPCACCSGQVCQRKDWGSGHKFECANLKNLKHNAAKAAAAGGSSGGGGSAGSNGTLSCKPPFLDPNEDAPVPRQVLFPYELFLQLRKAPNSCRRAPIGLINHGNNCYANAALQCLLYTKPLRAYLDQDLHRKHCNRPHDRDWCLLCVLSVSSSSGVCVCVERMMMLVCLFVWFVGCVMGVGAGVGAADAGKSVALVCEPAPQQQASQKGATT